MIINTYFPFQTLWKYTRQIEYLDFWRLDIIYVSSGQGNGLSNITWGMLKTSYYHNNIILMKNLKHFRLFIETLLREIF